MLKLAVKVLSILKSQTGDSALILMMHFTLRALVKDMESAESQGELDLLKVHSFII